MGVKRLFSTYQVENSDMITKDADESMGMTHLLLIEIQLSKTSVKASSGTGLETSYVHTLKVSNFTSEIRSCRHN